MSRSAWPSACGSRCRKAMRVSTQPAVANYPQDAEQALVERLLEFRWDPLGCVLYSFPWGEPFTEYEHDPGPRAFQVKFLNELGAHLQDPETRYQVFRKTV